MVKILPRQFLGEVDAQGNVEDPQAWLDHFEMVSIANGWATDALKIQNMLVYLVREAHSWYMVNRATINHLGVTWRAVCDTMVQRFRPANYIEELDYCLRNLSIKQGESVRAYNEQYRQLHEQMGAAAPALQYCHLY